MTLRLLELTRLFLKLGSTSFGGPAAHLSAMEHEVVQRRAWLTHEEFLDLVGATHLIPGPNAVEMAGHVGYRRAGPLGSLVAALSFTIPAVLITLLFAVGYVRYGTLPEIKPIFNGIQPAILAVIITAVFRLARKAFASWQTVVIGLGVAVASFFGVDEVVAILVGGLAGVCLLRVTRPWGNATKAAGVLAGVTMAGKAGVARAAATVTVGAAMAGSTVVPLWKLGLFFLKVGAVMYGGGYVLIAYMEGGLVDQFGWITKAQLVDAVAIGQFTPGPLLTTATFVGYLVAGWPGATVATIGILLPCFFLVAVTNPIIPRLRQSRWASLFLDAVNAAAIGLMIVVVISLCGSTLFAEDSMTPAWRSCLIALSTGLIAVRWKIAPAWLVLAGAAAGWVLWYAG